MRNLILGCIFGLLIGVPLARTQQNDSIVVGAPVSIGMAKESALSRIKARGYIAARVEGPEDAWIISERDKPDDALGQLSFDRNGTLAWATHTWSATQSNEALKLGRSLYFVLRSFEQYGQTSCVISTSGTESISLDMKTAQIRCGRHTVALNLSRQDNSEYVAVDEQLVK